MESKYPSIVFLSIYIYAEKIFIMALLVLKNITENRCLCYYTCTSCVHLHIAITKFAPNMES